MQRRRRRRLYMYSIFSSLILSAFLALPPPSHAKGSGNSIPKATTITTTHSTTTCLDANVTLPILHNTTCTTDNTRRKRTKRKRRHSKNVTTKPPNQPFKKEMGSREATCLRRIKREWHDAVQLGIAYDWMQMKTLSISSNENYNHVRIGPLRKNLLKWHFSVMGPSNSVYEGGVYHGRVLLPKTYPASPPRIQVFTPSGRFIPRMDICLSASSFHPESWTPQWTILSLVEALRLHMLTTANEIGGKDDTPQQRRRYAQASRTWRFGRIDHALMIQQGIFAMNRILEEQDNQVGAKASIDAGGVQVAIQQQQHQQTRDQAAVVKRVPPKLSTVLVRAVVQVLTSPPRMALLFLFTVFILLNRQ